MLAALFSSRAVLTIGTIAFLVFTCLHKDFFKQLLVFVKNPLLSGIALLFLIFLISGLWSEDHAYWMRSLRIKLPLLLFPFAFAGNWRLTKRQWELIAWWFVVLIAAGCCWSVIQYLSDIKQINTSYLRAKAIPTPLENDHIRFSLLVCVAIMACVMLWVQNISKKIRIVLAVIAIFFIAYLHLLSARTGLLGFYIFLLCGLVYLIMRAKNRKLTVVVCAIALLLPVAAWFLLPTFKNRVLYMRYDFSYIKEQTYLPGSNDGSRLVSLKAGWEVMKENPLGVGGGDVVNETLQWYTRHEPRMLSTGLYPSSEWLMYGVAAGWIGFVLFTIVMFIPFFERTRSQFFWVTLNLVMAFSFLFDIGLEVQFGVFIYAFVVLWWWKWLDREKELKT